MSHALPRRKCPPWAWIVTGGALLACALFLTACGDGPAPAGEKGRYLVQELTAEQKGKLGALRILFGHQSVGQNIVQGLEELAAKDSSLPLRVSESKTPDALSPPFVAHFRVGRNTDPRSKIAAFTEVVRRGGNDADVASFKFCYVDIEADTDVDALFAEYKRAVEELSRQFPRLTILHVTVPVTTPTGGVKRLLKKVMGKSTGEEANVRRTRLNDLLRREYGGKAPLFDLAAWESSTPDGASLRRDYKGEPLETLWPEYTDDGEHLNAVGRRRLALALAAEWSKLGGAAR